MKKLLLLAVVILGIAATSFAQAVTANASANGVINTPVATPLSINWVNDMDFGTITLTNSVTATQIDVNNFIGGTVAYMEVKPLTGPNTGNLTYTGSPKPAKFLVKNVINGGALTNANITLSGSYSNHALSGGHAWFDTNDAGGTNAANCPLGSYVEVQQVGSSNDWNLFIGGVLRMDKNATGGFNVSGLNVTVNGH